MSYLLIANICESSGFLKALDLIIRVVKLAILVAPFAVIIKGTIDIGKSLIMGDTGKILSQFFMTLKRLALVALIFFVPYFGKAFISLLEDTTAPITHSYNTCIENINNIEYYEGLEEIKMKEEDENFKKHVQEQKEIIKNRIVEHVQRATETIDSNMPSGGYINDGTAFMGKKYTLTDSQLKGIAYLCQREQGNAKGAAAEASLMANRFELFGSRYGADGNGLFNYVRNCRWWAKSVTYTSQGDKVDADVLASVKQVLVLGVRTLPLYVDEHDYVGDISKLNTNGKIVTGRSNFKNHSNYVKDQTLIYNRMGAKYTYYTHPTETSDPFGYTERAMNKVKGSADANKPITFGK